jgi:membrane protein implicated in regulation of membrane protease activity
MNPEPRVIAEVGGSVVAEQGPSVLIIDRRTGPLSVLAFVLGVIALVVGGFGAVALLTSTPSAALGAVFLVVGLVVAGATLATRRSIRRSRSKPLDSYQPVAVFDRERRVFVDGNGSVVAPLDQVRFQRAMQMTSSSPKLVAKTPNGTRVLLRGNPFSGGIGNLDEVLTAAVHGVR